MPQKRGIISDADKKRIEAALRAHEATGAEVRAAVLAAAEPTPEHGASVRELAAFTGFAASTISRWKRDQR